MQINRSKTTATTIALFLIITMTVTLVPLPKVNAHTNPTWTVPTWSYINVTPNPIGVGQSTLVAFWSNALPPTAIGLYGDRWTFTVYVTKPDGNKETLGPFTSDPIGVGYTNYTPTQIGTYTFVAHMDQHLITGLP